MKIKTTEIVLWMLIIVSIIIAIIDQTGEIEVTAREAYMIATIGQGLLAMVILIEK